MVPKNPQEELAVDEVSDTVKVHLALIPGENCKSLENKQTKFMYNLFSFTFHYNPYVIYTSFVPAHT